MLSRLMTRREQAVLAFLAVAIAVGAVAVIHERRAALAPPEGAAPIIETARPPEAASPLTAGEQQASASLAPLAQTSPALPPPPREETPETVSMKRLAVAVDGAVASHGLYGMHEGDRVADLIEQAGGIAEGADTSTINLAALLLDSTTLTIPGKIGPQRDGNAVRWTRADGQTAQNPPAYLRAYQGFATQSPAPSSSQTAAKAAEEESEQGGGLLNINTATAEELEELPGVGPVTSESIIAYRKLTPFTCVEDLDNVSGIGPAKLAKLRPLICVQ